MFHVDLMSHFVDPLDALRTMRRATRPGGVVAFEVGLLAGCHRDGTSGSGLLGTRSIAGCIHKAIYCLLEKAGLRPIATQQFGLLLRLYLRLAAGAPLAANKEDNSRSEVTADVPAQSALGIHYLLEHLIFGLQGMEPVAGHPS